MTAPPKRRWFRFSLQTMFVVVTVFGVWLGWNLKIVRERKAVLAEIQRINDLSSRDNTNDVRGLYNSTVDSDYAQISLARLILGDESCALLNIPPSLAADWIARAEQAFPEAELYILSDSKSHELQYRASLYTPAAERLSNKGTVFKTGLIEKSSVAQGTP